MSRPWVMPLDAREVVAVDVDVWEALEAERDALRARVAELEAKLSRVCDWAAGLCISHPHLVPHDIAHVEREEAVGDE